MKYLVAIFLSVLVVGCGSKPAVLDKSPCACLIYDTPIPSIGGGTRNG